MLTITFGSWLFPLTVTAAAFGALFIWESRQPPTSGYGAIGAGLGMALMMAGAIIVSLIAWLIWAILR